MRNTPLFEWRNLRGAALALLIGAAAATIAAPTGKRGTNDPNALILTNQVLVEMKSPLYADVLSQKYRLPVVEVLRGNNSWIVLQAWDVAAALAAERLMNGDPLIRTVANNSRIKRVRFQAFTPNDPFYAFNTPSGAPGQWHLTLNASGHQNVNAQAMWTAGHTGQGVIIGIVDDGLQTDHPDLSPAWNGVNSFDFGQGDANPNPVYIDDNHGTSVAGVAGARGGNAIGVTGAAPLASLAGLRCDFAGAGPAAQFVDATLFRSSGAIADRRIGVKNHSYGINIPYLPNAAEANAAATSAAAGTIHVVAAGNARGSSNEDSNKSQFQNSPAVITVAALGANGVFADYSSYGANVFVTAPSDSSGLPGITTTDRTGDDGYNTASDANLFPDVSYTNDFGGTSSASPLVAGVLGAIKQRIPAMDGRLAKHLLVRTSRVVDAWDSTPSSAGGWKTNGGGFRYNPNYGFGVIDAGALASVSRLYYSSGPRVTRVLPVQAVNASLPDNSTTGVTRTFVVSGTTGSVPIEDIQVRIRANHTFRGDLTATLRSPFGTVHRIVAADTGSSGTLDWTFNVNGFWGENPQGTWTINLADVAAADTGTWTDFQVTFNFGGPSSRLGSNILTYNPANTDIQMNALWQARSYANVALPARPAVAAIPVGVGDLDRDGRSDILYQNGVNLFYQPMWGYEAKAPVVGIGALAANQVAFGVADINRDGLGDVVVRNTVTGQVGFYNLNGAGTALGASVVIGTPPAGIVPFGVGDSTGDGQPDILMDKTTISRAVWIWQLQPGGAPFSFIFSGFQAAGFTLIGAGDLNFDGQPDFIARNNANGTVAGYTMNVLSISTISTLSPIPAGHTPFGAAAL